MGTEAEKEDDPTGYVNEPVALGAPEAQSLGGPSAEHLKTRLAEDMEAGAFVLGPFLPLVEGCPREGWVAVMPSPSFFWVVPAHSGASSRGGIL